MPTAPLDPSFKMSAYHSLKPKPYSAPHIVEVSDYFTPATLGTVTQCYDDVRQAGHSRRDDEEQVTRGDENLYSWN